MIPPLVSYPSIDAFLSDLREVARRTKVKKGNTPMQSLADMRCKPCIYGKRAYRP